MTSFLDSLREFGGSWEETNRVKLTAEERASLSKAVVVMSPGCHNDEYDFDGSLQVKLYKKNGKVSFAPLSKLSELEEGDEINLKTLEIITLSREGDEDIFKVDGEAL